MQSVVHQYNKPVTYRICIAILSALLAAACIKKPNTDFADLIPVNLHDSAKMPSKPHSKSILAKSILGLRNRSYSAGSFKILEAVPATNGLQAWRFRYESEGFTNYGLIEQPAGKPPVQGWPVIVLAHGYIPPAYYSTIKSYRLVTRYYAAGGFIVIKPDYRGHGRSEGGGPSPTRTIDYTIDVLNLIAGLDEIPNTDTGNLFLYGHSMGGEIALRILTVNRQVKGATLWAAVTQPFPENTLYFLRKRPGKDAQELQTLIDSAFTPTDYPLLSPESYFHSILVPILVHHGTADQSVPFAWSISFRNALDKAGINYKFFEYPGEDHNISRSFYRVMKKDMEFFRSLK